MNIIVTLILEPGDGSCIFCKLIILANHRLLLMIDEHRVKHTHTHKNYKKEYVRICGQRRAIPLDSLKEEQFHWID